MGNLFGVPIGRTPINEIPLDEWGSVELFGDSGVGIPGGKKAGLGALPVVFGCVSRATNRMIGMPVRILRSNGNELPRLPKLVAQS